LIFLSRRLSKADHRSIVDSDRDICEETARSLEVLAINGDGCDQEILSEAGISRADVVAAVTGDDEDNLVICQLAKERFGVNRTVGRVNDPDNESTFFKLGVDVDATKIIPRLSRKRSPFPIS
jgi:trk system potassium uptake protein TrkA